ncbi:MAG: hypothetical protein ABIQ38_04995, partial [Ilumatobacteraceae bacterium]
TQPIHDAGSGIVIVMSANDWESRELAEASRERLLTEIGMIRETYKTDASEELKAQVVELKRELLALKRELLAARDFAKGAAAHAGEHQARIMAQSAQLAAAQDRVAFLSKHINRMRNSTTWKIGRIAMLPVRIIKRITRRLT